MRTRCWKRPSYVVLPGRGPSIAVLGFVLALLHPLAARGQVVAADLGPGVDHGMEGRLQIGYLGNGHDGGDNLDPRVEFGGRTAFWRDSRDDRRLVLRFGSGAGGIGQPDNRRDFAQRLLLPGRLAITGGVAHEWDIGSKLRVTCPDVGFGAKTVPWRRDTTAYQVGITSGFAVGWKGIGRWSLQCARSSNAVGAADRRKVLAAKGIDGIWVTTLATSFVYQPAPGALMVSGTFTAYLGDSKFPFPQAGRRAFVLAVSKGLRL